MADMMTFPDTVEEFMDQYKMTDTKQVYSNGIEYVPIFRMEQWFEHEKAQLTHEGTTSDLISRQAAIDAIENSSKPYVWQGADIVRNLPTIQPEPKEGEWVQIQRCVGDTQPDLECPFCKHRIGWFDMGRHCAGCGAKLKGGAG